MCIFGNFWNEAYLGPNQGRPEIIWVNLSQACHTGSVIIVHGHFWSAAAVWVCFYLIIHAYNILEMRRLATVWKCDYPDYQANPRLTLLIWMLSSCCCHCRMFSMRCTQILMFPTNTDLPMSCTRVHSETYSVCSSSLMGLTFCWSFRTKTEQAQEEFQDYNCLHRRWQRHRNMIETLLE